MASRTFGAGSDGRQVAEALREQIRGKTVVVTGVSPFGIGAEFAVTIAPYRPRTIILVSRTRQSMETVARDIRRANARVNVRTIVMDLASLESVRLAARQILQHPETIDVLVNNAAVFGSADYQLSQDGFEATFAIAHLGHFLLTGLIQHKLSREARVINVSAGQHFWGNIDLIDPWFSNGQTYDRFTAYARAKTAAILFTKGLVQRGFVSFAVDPGLARTMLQREFSDDEIANMPEQYGQEWKPLPQAVATYIMAAFQTGLEQDNGSYMLDCQVTQPATYAEDVPTAEALWEFSERLCRERFGDRYICREL